MSEASATGAYTIPFAARLVRLDTGTVRRWTLGYERGGVHYDPAIHTSLPPIEGQVALTFVELVELMFVSGFRTSGLPFPKIREALSVARRLFGHIHPFAMKHWFVDPAGLYAEIRTGAGEKVLVELAGDAQLAIRAALQPYLHQLEFNAAGVAERWFPEGKDIPVVLDPLIAMGAPTIANSGITTRALKQFYQGDGSIDELAWWYGIRPAEVAAAIRFEEKLEAA